MLLIIFGNQLVYFQVVVKSEEVAEWNILRDDFMMGATMKDWDKESDEEKCADVAGEESASDR